MRWRRVFATALVASTAWCVAGVVVPLTPSPRKSARLASGCKVFILDIGDLAGELGFPTCDVDNIATDPETGVTFPNPEKLVANFSSILPTPMKSHEWIFPYNILPHYVGQTAGPWYVYQTLKNSPDMIVETIEEADVVYVYDYCYVMWALGDHHGRSHWWLRENYHPVNGSQAGHFLLSTYRAMMNLPKWLRNGGQDFVFFYSHPGFEWDDLDMTTMFQDMVCKDFAWSTVFIVEQAQRYRCPAYSPRNSLVVPYSSTEVVQGLTLDVEDEADHLLFFRGNCNPPVPDNMGKMLRHTLIKNLRAVATEDVTVCCSTREAQKDTICLDSDFPQTEFRVQVHKPYLQQMAKSVYCLILPGNSQSSQTLTEAFLTGCIPVFVGPPYHTLPFRNVVDYVEAGIFFNVTVTKAKGGINSMPWWPKPEVQMQWRLDPRSNHWDRYGGAWWFPDIPLTALRNITTYEEIISTLRDLPDEVVQQKQLAVLRQRPRFIYSTQPHSPPQAADTIIDMMCKYGSFGVRETPTTKTA